MESTRSTGTGTCNTPSSHSGSKKRKVLSVVVDGNENNISDLVIVMESEFTIWEELYPEYTHSIELKELGKNHIEMCLNVYKTI